MKKEIIISMTLLGLIIIANILVSRYIDDKFNTIIGKLNELEIYLEKKDYEQAQKKVNEIDDYFSKTEDVLSCYIEHDELEKVKTEFTSLQSCIRFQRDDAFEKLGKMSFIIRHIEEKDDLRLKNVF